MWCFSPVLSTPYRIKWPLTPKLSVFDFFMRLLGPHEKISQTQKSEKMHFRYRCLMLRSNEIPFSEVQLAESCGNANMDVKTSVKVPKNLQFQLNQASSFSPKSLLIYQNMCYWSSLVNWDTPKLIWEILVWKIFLNYLRWSNFFRI